MLIYGNEKVTEYFTTPKQSKRLLKLGVPANSADCYIGKDNKVYVINGDIPKSLIYAVDCVPCWSDGRLMEIVHICAGWDSVNLDQGNTAEYIINEIDYMIHHDKFDLSKLEE